MLDLGQVIPEYFAEEISKEKLIAHIKSCEDMISILEEMKTGEDKLVDMISTLGEMEAK